MSVINVTIAPNSKKQELIVIDSSNFKLKVKSPAENNRANLEVTKFFKKYFKKEVEIIKGKASRKKVIKIFSES